MVDMSIKEVMFCANDDKAHTVCWSDAANAWSVENEVDGLISHYDTLCSALTKMHTQTAAFFGVTSYNADYCALVPEHWTVVDNPY
jgi:hypothetical protein